MKGTFNKICVIGLGYIGLPTATILASRGLTVIGVDINKKIVDVINSGKIHIVEPALETIVHRVVNDGSLKAVTVPEIADVFIIAVPTPFKEDSFQPDLSYIEAAVQAIAPFLQKDNLIILESTSPVGTTEKISKQFAELRTDLIFPHIKNKKSDVNIAYCPERVMPGKTLYELIHNDRIIGGLTPLCTEKAKSLYQIFVTGKCLGTTSSTAEMVKLTENAYRDVNIAFANELSMICDKLQIDVWELIHLANHHPRVKILQPGPGVGGHCIAVDPWFIVHSSPNETKLIQAAREVNNTKPLFVLDKIYSALALFENPQIACLGITYKANSDDIRESPAIKILEKLGRATNAIVHIVEPNIKSLPHTLSNYKHFSLKTLDETLVNANIIIILVAHKEFHALKSINLYNKIVINISSIEDTSPSVPNDSYSLSETAMEYI